MKRYRIFFLLIIWLFLGLASLPAQEDGRIAKLSLSKAEQGLNFPEGNISLDLRDMDIIEALKYLATKASLNIIPTKGVSGRVTFMVEEVPIKDIFEIILRSNNLAYERKGNIYNVMTEDEYRARYGKNFSDSRVTKVFHLQYAIPEQAFNLLNTLKSEIGKILLDQESGVILAIDTPEKIKEMEATLDAMERKGVIQIFNLKYARAKDIEEQLKLQLDTKKVGSIKADERTNQVIVQTLPERMEDISRLIKGLDQKTKQILLDAKIIQVKLTDGLGSGVEWEGLFNIGNSKKGLSYLGSYPFSSVSGTTDDWRSRSQVVTDMGGNIGSYPFSGTATNYAAGKQSIGTQEMHLGVINGKQDFDTVIKYLQTLGETKILSNPKLSVVNNQEAKIHVGERQAYITTTTTQTQTSNTVSESVTYVDVGIQMSVTPTINEDGFVTVKIKPEISSVIDYLLTSSKNKIPIIDTSTAETIVMVKDGTSILIGGLSKEEKTSSSEQTPILGKMPFVGDAFKSKTNKSTRSELVIIITPHIISGDELFTGYKDDFVNTLDKEYQDYRGITEEAEKIESKPYQGYPSLGEVDKIPGIKPARNF
jgi:type II secretory pathway component GspD/PulD (secretin)